MARITPRHLLIGAALLASACSKPAGKQAASQTPWNNPSAIGPRSVLINRDQGNPYIYNPDNGATEEEPNREVGLAKLPQLDMLREVNPKDPQIPNR